VAFSVRVRSATIRWDWLSQGAGRLVEEEDPGPSDQRAGDHQTLLMSTR
jgi:hypothetical protein